MTNPFSKAEPAWAYRRSYHWDADTGLVWRDTKQGDELLLWLPDGITAVVVHEENAIEPLAWQETRLGPLPRTWTSRPRRSRPGVGARFFRTPFYRKYSGTVTTGVEIRDHAIPVWPSPATGEDQFQWFDPEGVPLLGAPQVGEFALLPQAWQDEFLIHGIADTPKKPETVDDWLNQFLNDTLIYTGERANRLTTEELYAAYREWVDVAEVPAEWRVNKIHLGRWISESAGYRRWAGRTPQGFRRGFYGARFPEVAQ